MRDDIAINSTKEENTVTPSQSEFNKTFGKHVTSSFLGVAISRLLALLLTKALSILLPKTDYGLYSNTLWRFFQSTDFKLKEKKSKLLSTAFYGSLGLAAIEAAFIYIPYVLNGYRIIEDPIYVSSLLVSFFLMFAYIIKEIVLVVSGLTNLDLF